MFCKEAIHQCYSARDSGLVHWNLDLGRLYRIKKIVIIWGKVQSTATEVTLRVGSSSAILNNRVVYVCDLDVNWAPDKEHVIELDVAENGQYVGLQTNVQLTFCKIQIYE